MVMWALVQATSRPTLDPPSALERQRADPDGVGRDGDRRSLRQRRPCPGQNPLNEPGRLRALQSLHADSHDGRHPGPGNREQPVEVSVQCAADAPLGAGEIENGLVGGARQTQFAHMPRVQARISKDARCASRYSLVEQNPLQCPSLSRPHNRKLAAGSGRFQDTHLVVEVGRRELQRLPQIVLLQLRKLAE